MRCAGVLFLLFAAATPAAADERPPDAALATAAADANLGRAYLFGAKRDISRGMQTRTADLYRAAAVAGHSRAQYHLALRTFLGIGTAPDAALAMAWFLVAREDADADLADKVEEMIGLAQAAMTPADVSIAEGQAATIWTRLPADVRPISPPGALLPAAFAAQR